MSRPYSGYRGTQPQRQRQYAQPQTVAGSKSVDFMAVALSAAPKKMAKKYIELDKPLPSVQSKGTEKEYREFVINLMETRAGVKRSEAEKWTAGSGMELLTLAMTHSSVDPTNLRNNYEILEFTGDAILNSITAYYLTESFVKIVEMGNRGVQYLSRQKALITSSAFFSRFSEKFGFAKFIRYRPLKYIFSKETAASDQRAQTQQIRTIVINDSMMEDAFEAFFAALVKTIDRHEQMIGVGYSIAYAIMNSIYSETYIPTSLNELVDPKSQLKEIFDKRRALYGDTVSWDTDEKTKELWVRIKFAKPVRNDEPSPDINIGPYQLAVFKPGSEDVQTTKAVLEQQASLDALKELQRRYPGDTFVRYKHGE
jgi:dsRNA-specific ribonuclease